MSDCCVRMELVDASVSDMKAIVDRELAEIVETSAASKRKKSSNRPSERANKRAKHFPCIPVSVDANIVSSRWLAIETFLLRKRP